MLVFATAVTVVLVVSFICSIFESVLLSVRRPQIELMAWGGERAGQLLKKFRRNMDAPIAAILILNTAAHTVGASVAGASYSRVFSADSLWLFTIVFTLAVLLFTEIVPKTLGVNYASTLAKPVAYGIHWLTLALRPLVVVSAKISQSLRSANTAPVTSVEEIRLLTTLGRTEGAVGQRTAGMIVGATYLRQLQVRDVMLPRQQVSFLSAEMKRNEVLTLVRESGHSRFPLSASGDIADVYGVVLAKTLLNWLLEHPEETVDWAAVGDEPLIVPETGTLGQFLQTIQESHRHLAIVVDEYGDVQGIVTLEDVLEEIVGDITDEHDMPVMDFLPQDDGGIIVRAHLELRKLAMELGVPWDPELEVATVGGLLSEKLEKIPVEGDAIAWHGYRIEVLRADRRRIRLLRVSPEA